MSQQSIALLTLSLLSAGVVAARRFVTPAGAQAGADANAIGVTRVAAAAAGELMPVDVIGTTTITSGAAFAAGATLKSDATGRGITWASAGARLAIALQAAGGADEEVEVLLIQNAA